MSIANFGFPLNDGTRLDHNSSGVDVRRLDIRVAFNWTGDSHIPIEDHIDRVEWTVQHSGRSYSTSHITREAVDGEWSMCGGRRCRVLRKLGSITITARAIYDDGGSPPVVHLAAEDSRAFRVVDTTPRVYIPSSRKPYCSGNRDKCNEDRRQRLTVDSPQESVHGKSWRRDWAWRRRDFKLPVRKENKMKETTRLAKIGLIALIDEATGYQKTRDKDALDKIYRSDQKGEESMTDTVTLQQALEYVGTGDVGLLGHALARVAPGLPPFDSPGLDKAAWDKVKAGVHQHVQWHLGSKFTVHALPGGRERITEGTSLDDPIVYEG